MTNLDPIVQPSATASDNPNIAPLEVLESPLHTAHQPTLKAPVDVSPEPVSIPQLKLTDSAKRSAEAPLEEIDDDDDRLWYLTEDCNQIRRKIYAFLSGDEMSVDELRNALNISAEQYSEFMHQCGKDQGVESEVYINAHRFFKKRELLGIRMPKKKAKKADLTTMQEISAVKLPGEEDVSVPIYATCDEIRLKIALYLRRPEVTQAAFLREIASTYPDDKKIQSKQLQDFLGKHGETAGNTSSVYYAGYVFFEKMRIKNNEPKTKERLEMESTLPGGADVSRPANRTPRKLSPRKVDRKASDAK